MFDWDSHYEDVVAATVLPEVTEAEAAPRLKRWASRGRALAGRWAMAAAVAAGLFAAGTGVSMIPRDAPGAWLSAVSRQTMQVLGLDDSAMPAGLLAYDQAQFDRFRHGIAGFTDSELLDFARVTQRDLNGVNTMAAYTHDALLLTHLEIDRRGLHRPFSSLRDAFQRS